MIRNPVESSNLASVGHSDSTLEVEFKNGAIYQYDGVTEAQFDAMMTADSVGKYLNAMIKPYHTYTKVETKPAVLVLYFLVADDFDLLVWAETPQQAVDIWTRYYEFDIEQELVPHQIRIVPHAVPTAPAAIGWDDVKQASL